MAATRNTHAGGWTEEREALLTRLWTEGATASDIAAKLGDGATRNAVLGRVHRMRLRKHGTQTQANTSVVTRTRRSRAQILDDARGKERRKPEAGKPEKRGKANTETVARARRIAAGIEQVGVDPSADKLLGSKVWEPLPGVVPVPLVKLDKGQCKWPIGDPMLPGFGFCGLIADPASSYCATHQRQSVGRPL